MKTRTKILEKKPVLAGFSSPELMDRSPLLGARSLVLFFIFKIAFCSDDKQSEQETR